MNALYKNQNLSRLEQETNLKLASIYIEQCKQLKGLGEFELAEEKGDLAHDLRVKAALSLYPHLSKEKVELIGAVVWFLDCYKFYPVLENAQTVAHNQKVSGFSFSLTSWMDYPEGFRNKYAWILTELYQNK